MKFILPNTALLLLGLTTGLKTASADNLRAPEAEEPTLTDVSDGLTIHIENGKVHRKLKGKGKGKGKFQSCQDMSGKWISLSPLTNYYSDGVDSGVDVNVALDIISASDTLCNYFGNQYFQAPGVPAFQDVAGSVALTAFPGYLGAKEGDNLFFSFTDTGNGPGRVEVCPGGQAAKIYIDAECFVVDGENVCSSTLPLYMAKFPDSSTQIVGKSWLELIDELVEQTDDDLQFC